MDLAGLLKLSHALVGALFLAGLVGRWVTLRQAARSPDIAAVHTLLGASAWFERTVIWTSSVVLVLGLSTAIAQGRPFLGPLQNAHVDWLFVSLVLYVTVIALIPLVFAPHGKAFAAALQDATSAGSVTDRLRLAFNDRVVFVAHTYELAAMTMVFALMVMKPF